MGLHRIWVGFKELPKDLSRIQRNSSSESYSDPTESHWILLRSCRIPLNPAQTLLNPAESYTDHAESRSILLISNQIPLNPTEILPNPAESWILLGSCQIPLNPTPILPNPAESCSDPAESRWILLRSCQILLYPTQIQHTQYANSRNCCLIR